MTRTTSPKARISAEKEPRPSNWLVAAVIGYVAIALTVDTLAAQNIRWPFGWSVFLWSPASFWRVFDAAPPSWVSTPPVSRVDAFKLIWWFIIPFLMCLPRMEWRWFSPQNWKRMDWLLLAGLIVLGSMAVVSVRFIPALRNTYGGMSHLSSELKRGYSIGYLVWIGSWLPGWTLLHRYFLLRIVMRRFPRYGWLLIPISETLYHLQKPLIEAGGMLVFSLLLTGWSVKRRNVLLPFIAHLYVEIALLVALVFFL